MAGCPDWCCQVQGIPDKNQVAISSFGNTRVKIILNPNSHKYYLSVKIYHHKCCNIALRIVLGEQIKMPKLDKHLALFFNIINRGVTSAVPANLL